MTGANPTLLHLQVIIPTLNAAATLPPVVAALRSGLSSTLSSTGGDIAVDLLVCDGGSTDGTESIAEGLGARVVRSGKGRGLQLRAGAEAALENGNPELILFLHADSALQPGWTDAVHGFAQRGDRNEKAGYFHLALGDDAPAARRLERLVAWRCRVFGLPYGDQGLLMTPALYRRCGGYATIPLMEDVDIVRRIGRGNMVALDSAVRTSALRYRKAGYLRRSLWNLFCLSLYFLGVAPHRIARLYG